MASNFEQHGIEAILECPICLSQLQEPQTLQKCLHSFCNSCIQKVPKQRKGGKHGWVCPMCQSFSQENELKSNFFINDLLEFHRRNGSTKKIDCEQCFKKQDATWKCKDCKLHLCKHCKVSHVNIPLLKHHRVIPFNKNDVTTVDRLIFCSKHKDEPIKFNCKECEVPMCITCKITEHDSHETETVKQALERILPVMRDAVKLAKSNLQVFQKQSEGIDKVICEVKASHSACKRNIHSQVQKIITSLQNLERNMNMKIYKEEDNQIAKLEQIKQTLQNRTIIGKNIANITDACLSNSQHISQLTELQGGLLKKIKQQSDKKPELIPVEITESHFDGLVEDTIKNLTSHVESKITKMRRSYTVFESGKISLLNILCADFIAHFQRNFYPVIERSISGFCNRITIINDKLWVCLNEDKEIIIYDRNGDIERHIENHKRKIAIAKMAYTKDIIAAGEEGIFETDEHGSYWLKIAHGTFSDISIHGELFSVLEYEDNKIMTFQCHPTSCKNCKWVKKTEFKLDEIPENVSRYNNTFTYLSGTFLVCCCNAKEYFHYNQDGKLMKKFCTSSYDFLCGLDSKNNILIARYSKMKLSISRLNENKDNKIDLP